MGWLRGTGAVAGLTVREAMRQRLWLVFAIVAAVFLVAVPRLQAVDDAARLKLSVLAITGAIGFVVVLLSILVGPAAVRRDVDAKTAYTLFAKPLPASAYLVGRWSGLVVWLLGGVVAMALAGVAAIGLQFGSFPTMRRTAAPAVWQLVSLAGETADVAANRERLSLSGLPGNGVRWRFTGLVAPSDPRGYELLLRAQVVGATPDLPGGQALVEVRALVDGRPRVLALDPQSPYGRIEAHEAAGRVLLKHRDNASRDLGQDFLRLRLPADAIVRGETVIQVTRLEGRSVLVFERAGSALVAETAGSLLANLLRGGVAIAAACALLSAFALLCAQVSNLGVTLLGGLTLYFAGSAHGVIRDTLQWEEPSQAVRRLLELMLHVLPDFNRFPVATELAAGQGIPWTMVRDAWLVYGAWAALFLALAWVAMRRREL